MWIVSQLKAKWAWIWRHNLQRGECFFFFFGHRIRTFHSNKTSDKHKMDWQSGSVSLPCGQRYRVWDCPHGFSQARAQGPWFPLVTSIPPQSFQLRFRKPIFNYCLEALDRQSGNPDRPLLWFVVDLLPEDDRGGLLTTPPTFKNPR